MPILDETNKKIVFRYIAQGSRVFLGFIIVLLAKRNGILSEVGKMINLSSIYSMIALTSLIPFMKNIWVKFSFWSVLRFVFFFQLISLIIPYFLYGNIAEYWLYWFLFSYAFSTISMQYIQDTSEFNSYLIPVIQILANMAAGICLLFFDNLIFVYFLPYQLTLCVSLVLLRPSMSQGIILGYNGVKNLLFSIVGLGMLLAVAWPFTFFYIRESQVAINRELWEELEFILRIGLSCAGVTISVILNYNVVAGIRDFSDLINRISDYLLYIVFIFMLGWVVGFLEVSIGFRIDLTFIVLAFLVKTLGAFGSFTLVNNDRLVFVVLIELLVNAVFYFGLLCDISSGFVFLAGSLFQTIVVYLMCRKIFS